MYLFKPQKLKLPFEQKSPSQLKTRLILGCSIVIFLIIGYFGVDFLTSYFATTKMLEVVRDLENKSNVKIDFEEPHFQWGHAAVETVRIGENSLALARSISADINLNPFSSFGFGNIKKVTIDKLIFRSHYQQFKKLLASTAFVVKYRELKTNPATLTETTAKAGYLLKNADITIMKDENAELVRLAGLTISHSYDEPGLLNFDLERLSVLENMIEQNLSGSIVIDSKGEYYPFQISHAHDQTKWDIKGRVHKNLDKLKLTLKSRGVSEGLQKWLPQELVTQEKIIYASKLALEYNKETNLLNFFIHIGSPNIFLKHDSLAPEAVGPNRIRVKLNGQVNIKTALFNITNGEIFYNDLPHNKGSGIHLTLATTKNPDNYWATTLTMPTTPCKNIFSALPKQFTQQISDFTLDGEGKFGLQLTFDKEHPDQFQYHWLEKKFDCYISSIPYKFSKERLERPFTVALANQASIHLGLNEQNNSSLFTPLDLIPKTIRMAFLASEDISFYQHNGFNFSALENALRKNLKSNTIVIGGSTISMQTTKNLFLSRDRTVARKIPELFLTWHLESILNKNRILEIYLNIIEFGPQIYGIAHAAKHFFNKHPSDLSLLESIYLSSILPSPIRRYQYYCNGRIPEQYDHLLKSRVKQMHHLNLINQKKYEEASNDKVIFRNLPSSPAPECLQKIAHHQTEAL